MAILKNAKALIPHDAGLQSTDSAVGRRIAKLLGALQDVNTWVAKGTLVDDCGVLVHRILTGLRGEGWRISVGGEKWKVLPPNKDSVDALGKCCDHCDLQVTLYKRTDDNGKKVMLCSECADVMDSKDEKRMSNGI